MKVFADTTEVGCRFATCGILRAVGSREVVAVCDTDRPYGFHAAALDDAATLAAELGLQLVELL